MKADYIKNIVDLYDKSPYKCILIDGPWGVGKSYAIEKALEDNDNVCNISMFGINDAQAIYHEVFFQLAAKGKNGFSNLISKVADAVAVWAEKEAVIKGVIESFVKEKELFFNLAKNFNKVHFIVIDDLERMKGDINLEEVFGIVDELKKCNYVKVILVANTSEITQKECFNKYSEKVIERVYHITELPENVDWPKLRIHDGFISAFLSKHQVKNLRTLQKAQNLYDDFRIRLEDEYKEDFYDEIKLACYAIVVETIEKLYYREPNMNQTDAIMKVVEKTTNRFKARINNYYLREVRISNNMIEMILKFYENEIMIDSDEIAAEYQIFLHAGERSNFYKSDEEIKQVLPDLAEKVKQETNIIKMIKYADEYFIWSRHLELDNEQMKNEYKTKLHDMIYKEAMNGNVEYLTYGIEAFHVQEQTNIEIIKEVNENVKRAVVHEYIRYLANTPNGDLAYEYSYRLRDFMNNTFFRKVISGNVDSLYNEKLFPIHYVTDQKYRIAYNTMYVLYHENEEKFLQFCDELQPNCDHMARHRINVIVEQLVKEI